MARTLDTTTASSQRAVPESSPPKSSTAESSTAEGAIPEGSEAKLTQPRSLAKSVALPSLAVAGSLSALDLLRRRYQKSQLFLPERYPSGNWDPKSLGLKVKDVWFPSVDDVQLHGWWIDHPQAFGTLLYCHGNKGSIAHRIGALRWLHRIGLNLFAFDYRGYGRSDGTPSEAGLFQDVRAAHDYLTQDRGVSAGKLILFGHSLGGAVAIDGAGQRPVAGLVVQSSFTDVRSMARHNNPKLPLHWIATNQFRSITKVDSLTMPKLFIHGTADETIPLAMGQELFAAAAEPKEFLTVDKAGHNGVEARGGEAYVRRLRRFAEGCFGAPLPGEQA